MAMGLRHDYAGATTHYFRQIRMSVHARGHAQIRQLAVTPVAERPGVGAGLGSSRRGAGPAPA
jgi:hypothetical protein